MIENSLFAYGELLFYVQFQSLNVVHYLLLFYEIILH